MRMRPDLLVTLVVIEIQVTMYRPRGRYSVLPEQLEQTPNGFTRMARLRPQHVGDSDVVVAPQQFEIQRHHECAPVCTRPARAIVHGVCHAPLESRNLRK